MKKMRQTLALLLAGALTVGSFAGCGGSKAGGETAGTETCLLYTSPSPRDCS